MTTVRSELRRPPLSPSRYELRQISLPQGKESWRTVLTLAYQSLGVVYGDLSTSPLYVYTSTFAEDNEHSDTNEEVYGVLSCIFWTLTLIPLLNYVFIVHKADDNGEGGTFALYSLLCRHAKVNSLPSSQLADEELSTYKKDINIPVQTTFGVKVKSTLERHRVLQRFLLVLALSGTSMVIGDGILTPAISVFSAISGAELSLGKAHHLRSEAMFADLGHFSQLSIKIAFTSMVYPSLVLAYVGQAAYLSRHHVMENDYQIGFYVSVPDTKRLGNAAGLAVITVMLVTTCLMSLVIVLCWNQSVLLAVWFVIFFGTIEALYFSASLIKFLEGAWVPIAILFVFMVVMCIWHYGSLKKYEFDVQNRVSIDWLLSVGPSLGIVRVRGIGLIYTEHVSGIPAIFPHLVTNFPAFHQVLVFICVKSVPIPHVRHEERFLVGHIGPREHHLYRCIVRYGYRDAHKDDLQFENDLVCSIAEFIRTRKTGLNGNAAEDLSSDLEDMTVLGTPSTHISGVQVCEDNEVNSESVGTSKLREMHTTHTTKPKKRVRFLIPETPKIERGAREELHELMEASEAGIAYILGHSYVRAKQGSSLLKKIVINIGYDFLTRSSRPPAYALTVPHASTIELGTVYHV
ncbi:hypothetical protein RND71_010479 [Anisodus tanguticus]|uniref:Potassium transporter n=1 Tax=Anisodus tanguticus TaxID=243964 RepID=A0AAE1VS73_9SOLA|nr:hypothetical protein RND71_010479 [Anisodus tanguticus]